MTNSEVIEVLEKEESYMLSHGGDRQAKALRIAIDKIEQEPIKGHWIEHPHECGINWEYSMYECSECHEWTEDNSDFCPNCGAYMREDWD